MKGGLGTQCHSRKQPSIQPTIKRYEMVDAVRRLSIFGEMFVNQGALLPRGK